MSIKDILYDFFTDLEYSPRARVIFYNNLCNIFYLLDLMIFIFFGTSLIAIAVGTYFFGINEEVIQFLIVDCYLMLIFIIISIPIIFFDYKTDPQRWFDYVLDGNIYKAMPDIIMGILWILSLIVFAIIGILTKDFLTMLSTSAVFFFFIIIIVFKEPKKKIDY